MVFSVWQRSKVFRLFENQCWNWRRLSYVHLLGKLLVYHLLLSLAPRPISQPAVHVGNRQAIANAMVTSRDLETHCDSIVSLNN